MKSTRRIRGATARPHLEGGAGSANRANTIWPLRRCFSHSCEDSSTSTSLLPRHLWKPGRIDHHFTMATSGGPSPEQLAAMQQQFAAEAARRGLTPEQFAQQQREQLAAEAGKHGVSVEQYVAQLRMRAMMAHQKHVESQQQAQTESGEGNAPAQQQPQQPQQTATQVPVNPSNPPDPKAVAVAQFLRSQNLKPRTCIMDGQRKDMFKGMVPHSGADLVCVCKKLIERKLQ